MSEKRQCGECRLCCKLLYIGEKGTRPDGTRYEFVHYPGTWCKHAGEGGCALHGTPLQPYSCKTFQCLWLLGFGREEDRPDKIKLVATVEVRSQRLSPDGPLEPDEEYLIVYDAQPDAHLSKRAERFTTELWEFFEHSRYVSAVEIVPSDPRHTQRTGWHKVRGLLEIRLQERWPPLLDADVEREDVRAVLGSEESAELAERVKRTSREEIDALRERINARQRARRAQKGEK